jgi:excisionase family DNA binding protein
VPARLLTLEETAAVLRCSTRTLRRHVRAGTIQVVELSPKQRRVREQDLDRFVFDNLRAVSGKDRSTPAVRGVRMAPGERLWD